MSNDLYYLKLERTLCLLCVCLMTGGPLFAADRCSSQTQNNDKTKDCVILLDAGSPSTPLPVIVAPGKTVDVVVKKKLLQSIKFDETDAVIASPDVAGSFLKSFISPLSGLQVTESKELNQAKEQVDSAAKAAVAPPAPGAAAPRPVTPLVVLEARLDAVHEDQVQNDGVVTAVNRLMRTAQTDLGVLDSAPAASVGTAMATVLGDIKAATTDAPVLPVFIVRFDDREIASIYKDAQSVLTSEDLETLKRLWGDVYARQVAVKNELAMAQSAQESLAALGKTLAGVNVNQSAANLTTAVGLGVPMAATWQSAEIHRIKAGPDHTKTLTITIKDVTDPDTTTALATVVVTWQSNLWELSTGALFSLMPVRSFQNTPQFSGGKPVVDANGDQVSFVTETDTRPTVVFPFVMGNFRLLDGEWAHREVALLLSGGLGLNLSTTTPDFGTGVSVRWGSVYITPLVHVGRETRLTNNVQLNQSLGANPPDPPTEKKWVAKLGFALSYRLPI